MNPFTARHFFAALLFFIGSAHAMGMMEGGMMKDSRASFDGQVPAKSADALLSYIRSNDLPCTQCHSVSESGFGPSFASISANYAKRKDAAAILQQRITDGYGRMPAGLASKAQAERLAKLIIDLAK